MKYIPVLFADWANGLFAVLLTSYLLGIEPLWWYFLIGVLLSHLPDVDALPELLKRKKVSASSEHPVDHRAGLHFPLIFVMISAVVAYYLGYWGYVLFFSILFHYGNDFYGTGWGLRLFWPISMRSYKLLGRRVNRMKHILIESGDWDTLTLDEKKLRLIVSWSNEELSGYIKKWGMEDWIELIYYRFNWISCIEYFLFILACTMTIIVLI